MESAGQILVRAASTALTAAPDDAHTSFRHHAQVAQEQFVGFIPYIKRALYIMTVVFFLGIASLATYGLFYIAVMPSNKALKPLYFDYSGSMSSTPSPCLRNDLQDATSCIEKGYSKKELQSPVAKVDLFAKHASWHAFQSEVLPPPVTPDRLLQAGQAYFMDIALLMPETEVNRHLGMFTVSVELRSDDTVLATSVRSARFPHESHWLGIVRKLTLLVPLLLGALEESRTLAVSPFAHFVESEKYPLVSLL